MNLPGAVLESATVRTAGATMIAAGCSALSYNPAFLQQDVDLASIPDTLADYRDQNRW